jgi:23S rRNA pseudouridine2605 synthase
MAKKSTKTTKADDLQATATETEAVAEPQAQPKVKAKPKASTKAKTKKAVKPTKVEDPIGDETDGEAKIALGIPIGPASDAGIEAAEDTVLAEAEIEDGLYTGQDLDAASGSEHAPTPGAEYAAETEEEESEPEFTPRPPVKLERLQKILAQAGVASRRKAEEMIEHGRVQVNGKVVTALGTKADAGRDHIRVDGKLLQGAERLRYFVLNKPRGFVTTVKDPEGRPTVMQFFDKMRERLYPVGRLDYMSEGLLLVTNDGELANRLTRASAAVEKTYLVKVAGQPTEAELDILRAGVAIERGKPGSDKVRTSPARIRQVRQGDNPWYEVVLIEGRNRELRKMFEEVGHFVEKIRRVGYGPLVLDQEPGNLRELDPRELELLRKAADGTLRTPKSKDLRRRNLADAELPTVVPRTTAPRPSRPFATKSFEERPAAGPKDYRPKKSFDQPSEGARVGGRPTRPGQPSARDFGPARPAWQKPAWKKEDRPARPPFQRSGPPGESRPRDARPYNDRPATGRTFSPESRAGRDYRDKPASARPFGDRPAVGKPFSPKPAFNKPTFNKPASGKPGPGKPGWSKSARSDRPLFSRPTSPRREQPHYDEDLGPVRPPNLHIEEIHGPDRSAPSRPSAPRPSSYHSGPGRAGAGYSGQDRAGSGRSSSARPFRSEGSLARPFTTSSGKPRAGGARPNSKPVRFGKTADRPFSAGPKRSFGSNPSAPTSRSFRRDETEGTSAPPRATKPGWKPKPSFGSPAKPGFSSHSKPRQGGSGYKGKPSGPKRGGKPSSKKRG